MGREIERVCECEYSRELVNVIADKVVKLGKVGDPATKSNLSVLSFSSAQGRGHDYIGISGETLATNFRNCLGRQFRCRRP